MQQKYHNAFALQEGFAPPEELEAGAVGDVPEAAEPALADGLLPAQEEYWTHNSAASFTPSALPTDLSVLLFAEKWFDVNAISLIKIIMCFAFVRN